MNRAWIEPARLAARGMPIDAKAMRSLHQHGVQAISSLTEHPLWSPREMTPTVFADLDVPYYHAPIPDHHPPSRAQAQDLRHLFHALAHQQRAVLVHYHAGVGRTGTVLHLFYVRQGATFEHVYAKVTCRRMQCMLLSDAQQHFLQGYQPNG